MSIVNPDFIKPIFPIVETAPGEFTHQIPEAMHPGFIRGDGEANEKAKRVLTFGMDELTKLNVGRVKGDPNHNDQIGRSFNEIGNAITEARTALKGDEKRLTDGLVEKTGFKVDPAMMALVVGTFQAMPPQDHPAAIAALIDEGDGGTLAILHKMSGVLTKVAGNLKATIEPQLFRKADPDAYARLENTRFNLGRIERASIETANACAAFSAPMHKAANEPQPVHKSVAG
ncbi:hypothetical protein [Sphingomonas melonis]|uniref:hypothetical protein n=1 Tax=Sphingomonas melonis TaxID=152682 RepID=UPI0035C78EB2